MVWKLPGWDWQSCEINPKNRPIRSAKGGPLELTSQEIYNVLVDMINPPNPETKHSGSVTTNKPGIHLFDISKRLEDADIKARKFCDTAGACPATGRSKFANCEKMQKGHKTFETPTQVQEIMNKLVQEQDAQAGGSFAGLYGKYTLAQPDCGTAKAGFGPENPEVDGTSCRLKGVVPVSTTDGYWKTTWRNKDDSARIVVTYAASRDLDLKRGYSELVTEHGMGGDDRGWQWADRYGNMDINLVVRSTLNGLRVKSMMLSKNKGIDDYMLCGAHRLNFAYHKVSRGDISANTGWGESTYAEDKLLNKMNANGLATDSLFDPLGLVWLLLWKKEKREASDDKEYSYYMCAAHMHPHFADLITGILPERYDVCTATRWWNTAEHSNEWFAAKSSVMNFTVAQITQHFGTNDDWVDWVADKIRKPFFRIREGAIEVRSELKNALDLEGKRAGSKSPLKKLVDILKHVYFDIPIETPAPKPQGTEKPGTNGTNGNSVTTVTAGNSVTTVTAGNQGAGVTTGASDPATGLATKPPVPPDQADDASKGTGTGTPVPTGTGTPAKEESFWDKNQYYIIGGIVGLVLLLGIVAFIVVSRRRGREDLYESASYEQLGESDPGYTESLGEQGPEGLELEGLGEGPEDLGGGGPEDLTRFGF